MQRRRGVLCVLPSDHESLVAQKKSFESGGLHPQMCLAPRLSRQAGKVELAHRTFDALDEAGSWIDPEIVSLGQAKVGSFVVAQPSLTRLSFGIREGFRQAGHTLSPEEQKNWVKSYGSRCVKPPVIYGDVARLVQ